jgi:hypothetical protein
MKDNRILPAWESAGTTAPSQKSPPHRILVVDDEDCLRELSTPYRPLPCQADRQKIIAQAELVLAEARAIARQWDGSLALLSPSSPPNAQTPPPRLSLPRAIRELFSETLQA